MKILFASHNKNKVDEVKKILKDVDLVSLIDLNDHEEVEENGNTLEENAFLKASHFFKKYHCPVISDDTGLFVEALNGAPGVHSARYSGKDTNYKRNNEKLLKELDGVCNRKACFMCVVCYIDNDGKVLYFKGKVDGEITKKETVANSFGYDSVFYVSDRQMTYAEMDVEEKNKISHRYLALEALANYLREKAFEKMVEYEANQILDHEDAKIEKRLLGGMSNYTYVVSSDDELYTIRFIGEYAEEFVNREHEARNIKLMEHLGVTNKTIYFDITSGVKMSKYIEGKPLSELNEYPYEKVAQILKIIHNSPNTSLYDYKPFSRLESYENLLKEHNYVISSDYLEQRERFMKYRQYLESQKKTLCHGDSQPSNFIFDGEKITIVDFEFTGNNDLIYDIACFANIRLEEGLKLLETYFDVVTSDHLKRFYLWRTFQCFQWYNVATFKALVGLSEALHIDFTMVAKMYLENIKKLLDIIEKID